MKYLVILLTLLSISVFAQPEIDNQGITGGTIGVPKPTLYPEWLMGKNADNNSGVPAFTGISTSDLQDTVLTSVATNATLTGTVDMSGAVGITGVLTATGGIVTDTLNISRTIWNKAGAVHSLTVGTDVACDDGDRHYTEIYVPYTTVATGIFYLIGSVGGTDSVIVELFDIDGDLVQAKAISDTTIVGTAATFQQVPFLNRVTLNPGRYYMSAQFDGTTAKYRAPLIPGSTYGAATEAGTFSTKASIVPDSTWTVSEGIIGGIY